MEAINQILLALSAFLVTVSAARLLDRPGAEPELNISGRVYKALLVFFILAALFIRLYKFGQVPGGFNVDGAMAAVDAKALADHGTDRYGMSYPVHLTGWVYGQMSSLMSYLMAPLIKLFGLCPIVARLPQLIVSLLGILVLYLFVKDAFGKNAALAAGGFAAIAPWHVLQSRWALDCNLYPHFFLFGVFFLHRCLGSRRRKLLLSLSMVMFGLCMYCYGISIYTMPLFLLLACIYLLARKRVSIAEALLALAVWLAVALPFITVMAINFFGWETIELGPFTLPYFPYSTRSGDILFFSEDMWYQLRANIKSLLTVVFLQEEGYPWNNIPEFGSIYLFSAPFAVLGLVWTLTKLKNNDGAVLLLIFFITGLWCGVCTNGVNINRINIIFYPQMIFTALGIYSIMLRMRSFPLRLGLCGAYLLAFALFATTYFGSYAMEMSYYFDEGLGQALISVKDREDEKLYVTSNWGEGIYPNSGEILTMFYHQTDAEYFQGKSCPEGWLPFDQRYTFSPMDQLEIDPDEDAIYVVLNTELDCFDLELYDAQQYGNYYVLERK